MTEPVEPRAEFRHVTAEEVRAALASAELLNPVEQEVARLLEGYTRNFIAYVQQLGYIPSHALQVKPQTAIEAVAMAMMAERLKERAAVIIQTDV